MSLPSDLNKIVAGYLNPLDDLFQNCNNILTTMPGDISVFHAYVDKIQARQHMQIIAIKYRKIHSLIVNAYQKY